MTTINRDHGLRSDSAGFLVGQRRIEKSVQSVNTDTQEIIKILQELAKPKDDGMESRRLSDFQRTLIEANRRLTEDTAKVVQQRNRNADGGNPSPGGNRPTVDSADLQNGSNTPSRTTIGSRRTVDIRTVEDLLNMGGAQDQAQDGQNGSGNRERDKKGRFVGDGSGNGVFSKLTQSIRDGVSNGVNGIDTKGVDPTVDAMNELGTLISPIGKLAGTVSSPIASFLGRKDDLPPAEERHNRSQIRLLQKIADKVGVSGSSGIGAMLLRGFTVIAPAVAVALAAAVGAAVGNAVKNFLSGSKGGQKVLDTVGDITARGMAALGNKDAQEAVAANDKADDAKRYKDRKEDPNWYSTDGAHRFVRSIGFGGVSNDNSNPNVGERTKNIIRNFEGYQKTAKWDVDAYRLGYGSDSITNEDGSYRKVKQGDSVDKSGAERDLVRRSQIFANDARKSVGAEVWDKLPLDTQAALTSVAYNYGSLPKKVIASAKTGNLNDIESSVRSLQNHNKGINAKRRNTEADIISNSSKTTANPSVVSNLPTNVSTVTNASTRGSVQPVDQTNASTSTTQSIIKTAQGVASIDVSPRSTRSAPQAAPMPAAPVVREQMNSDSPQKVQVIGSNDTINQNVGDRDIAHAVTGGLGERR